MRQAWGSSYSKDPDYQPPSDHSSGGVGGNQYHQPALLPRSTRTKRTQPKLLDPLRKPTTTGKRGRRCSRGNHSLASSTCHRELNMASDPHIAEDINVSESPKCGDPSMVKVSNTIDGHLDLPLASRTRSFDDQADRRFDLAMSDEENTRDDVEKSHLAFGTIEKVGSFSTNSSLAQILHNIINKHGDISKECSFLPSFVLTTMLEGICRVVQELEGKKLDELDCSILDAYDSFLQDAERMKFNVKWLRLRVGELGDAARSFIETKEATYEKAERMERIEDMKKDLQKQKADVERLKSIIEEREQELALETHQAQRLIKKINSFTTRYQCFLSKSLVDGLL